jgi:hypothetical protein
MLAKLVNLLYSKATSTHLLFNLAPLIRSQLWGWQLQQLGHVLVHWKQGNGWLQMHACKHVCVCAFVPACVCVYVSSFMQE